MAKAVRASPKLKQREALAAAIIIQKSLCSYGGKSRCDCKFGVVELGKVRGGEHGCGCPELHVIAAVIAGLTEKQYRDAYARGTIKIAKARRAEDESRSKSAWILRHPWTAPVETVVFANRHVIAGFEEVQNAFISRAVAWKVLHANACAKTELAEREAKKIQAKIDELKRQEKLR